MAQTYDLSLLELTFQQHQILYDCHKTELTIKCSLTTGTSRGYIHMLLGWYS